MSKALMISIKPQYVAKILNGEKTIEIRKTMPKCELPIDVYIYCTKGEGKAILEGTRIIDNGFKKELCIKENKLLNGKVVAKFTLNKVEEIKYHFGYYDMGEWTESYILQNACLTPKELDDYLKASKEYDEKKISRVYGYAWHIDNLEIFDKPKELESYIKIRNYDNCINCSYADDKTLCSCYWCYVSTPLERPFQSWGYIEVEKK